MFSKMFRSTTLWLLIAGLCIGYLALPMMASSAKSHFLFLGQPLENSNRLIHKKVQVFLAGDSTVETFRDDVYPMQGWGQRISDFFTSEVSFVNKSVGGRSSKSFIDEGLLDAILNEINPRDYLFIQFGHNDLKSDAKRHTDPYTSYKKYLQMYIDGAEKHDAIPVLITPVARRSYQSDGNLKMS